MRRFKLRKDRLSGGVRNASFFMQPPTIEKVKRHGLEEWRVEYGGMVRYFAQDWKAKWHYESCLRLYRSKVSH